MTKEKQIQEYQNKQLIEELSKMPPMVMATAYLHAINYTLYGEDVTEKWVTATQNASALEKAYKKGYYDALQRQAESLEQEPKTGWIPVGERLPLLRGLAKISDDVLITNGYENDMGYLVKRKGKIFWHYYGSEYEVGIKDEDNDATAWMPLPEPYIESED